MNKYAPIPNDNGTTDGGGGLSSADLAEIGIMGDVEPGFNSQPKNPDAVGTTVPDTVATPDAPAAPTKPAAVTPTQPTAPVSPAEQSVIEKVMGRKGKTASRDYTGLDERAKGLFERMSNEAYAELYPLYKRYIENKDDFDKLPELKQQLNQLKEESQKPRDYYDHEHAYLLSPSYQDGLRERNSAEQVRDFWQEQLQSLESGQPFRILIEKQLPDGSTTLVPSQAIDPKAPNGRAHILSQLTRAESAYGAASAKLSETAKAIKGKYANFNKVGETLIDSYFGKFKDQLKPGHDKYIAKFAPELRHHPAMRFAAFALAALEQATADGDNASIRAAADAANRSASRTSGPTADEVTSGVAKKVAAYSDEEYKKMKGEYGL